MFFIRRFLSGLLHLNHSSRFRNQDGGWGGIPDSSPTGKESRYGAIRLAAWVAGLRECRKIVIELQRKSLAKCQKHHGTSTTR
jgi:hypothetical protein